MPDETQRRRFEMVVQSANEPMVRRYLEEAYRCFVAEAYNGAIVMAWNAAAHYLRQVVERISMALFEHNYTILRGQNPPAELRRINDSLFVQTCHRMGLSDVVDCLEPLRNRRNDCAHPSGIFVSPDEAVELVESIRNVISRQVVNERLTNPAIVQEFVRTASEQDGAAVARWVQEGHVPQLAHDLLTIFERDNEVNDVSGIIGLWRGLWDRLDDQTKERLWHRIEEAVQATLQDADRALRTPEEWVRLIVWPSSDLEHTSRDRVGQLFVEWLESLAQSGQFREVDMALARALREHLPAPLRDRLQAALRDMARRYVE